MSNTKAQAKPAAKPEAQGIWQDPNSAQSVNKDAIYLNVALEVAPDIIIRMPLNCPVDLEMRGLSAEQRKLFEMFVAKVENAESDEDLQVHPVAVHLSLYKKGSKEADNSGWQL